MMYPDLWLGAAMRIKFLAQGNFTEQLAMLARRNTDRLVANCVSGFDILFQDQLLYT